MSSIFTRYQATIRFRDAICGGLPGDPNTIEAWIAASAYGGDKAALLREYLVTALTLAGTPPTGTETMDELLVAGKAVAGEKHTTRFKRLPDGSPCIEGRIVKAMLKEAINILYAGDRTAFGANNRTKKGAKSFAEERVYVEETYIPLNVAADAIEVELFMVHTSGPSGPINGMNYVEMVRGATIQFTVKAAKDCIPGDDWASIWEMAQEVGLGAKRSQSFGRFDIVGWERLPDRPFVLPVTIGDTDAGKALAVPSWRR